MGAANWQEQFGLLMASNDYPDLVNVHNFTQVSMNREDLISREIAVPLNDLIAEHAPNFGKYAQNEKMAPGLKNSDGTIAAFMRVMPDEFSLSAWGPVFRKDWLDRLGLDVPETIPEWHDVLVAFRDEDPNGNGKQDEIPYTIADHGGGFGTLTRGRLFIGAYGLTKDYYVENGEVKFSMFHPSFKDYIALMQSWFEEGLIDPEFATSNRELITAKWINNELGSQYMSVGGGLGAIIAAGTEVIPDFDLVGAPYPVLKRGDPYQLGFNLFAVFRGGTFISTQSDNPEAATKFMDFLYSDEGIRIWAFGEEGNTYNIVDGKPVFTEKILKPASGTPQDAWQRISPANGMYIGGIMDSGAWKQAVLARPQQVAAFETWGRTTGPVDRALPISLTIPEDIKSRVATTMNDLETYLDEVIVKLIMGEIPIEDYDKTVERFRDLGVDEVVAAYQEALDQYLGR